MKHQKKQLLIIGGLSIIITLILSSLYRNKTFEIYTTQSGAAVILQQETSPFVAVNIFIKDLKAAEQQLPGLANITLSMLLRGTTSNNKQQLAKELENIGADINVSLADDYGLISALVLKENHHRLIKLLAEIIYNADFPEKELAMLKSETIMAIRKQKENPFNYALLVNKENNFPKHHYGYSAYGTEQAVNKITAKQCAFFRSDYILCAPRIVIVVNGDFEHKLIKNSLTELTKDLHAVSPPKFKKPEKNTFNTKKIYSYGYETTTILYNSEAPSIDSEKYPATALANSYLSHGLSSPLFKIAREENGIGYNVGSIYWPRKSAGLLSLFIQTNNNYYNKIIDMLDSLLDNTAPSKQDFQKSKKYHLTQYYRSQQTLSGRGKQIGYHEVMGLGWDYNYPENINKVSYQDFFTELFNIKQRSILIVR
jgi:zinc protease